jgi:hypothetical protein
MKPLLALAALALFAIPAHADTVDPLTGQTLVPIGTVNAELFFLPVADNIPNDVNLFITEASADGSLQGSMGFIFASDPFTLSGNQMTFLPGNYFLDPLADGEAGPEVNISDPLNSMDNFVLDVGYYTFTLPSTITVQPNAAGYLAATGQTGSPYASGTGYLSTENVSMTVSAVPEPSLIYMLAIGLLSLVLIKKVA